MERLSITIRPFENPRIMSDDNSSWFRDLMKWKSLGKVDGNIIRNQTEFETGFKISE